MIATLASSSSKNMIKTFAFWFWRRIKGYFIITNNNHHILRICLPADSLFSSLADSRTGSLERNLTAIRKSSLELRPFSKLKTNRSTKMKLKSSGIAMIRNQIWLYLCWIIKSKFPLSSFYRSKWTFRPAY